MARQISGSVGLSAKNNSADVQSVQELLNFAPRGLGGPEYPVTVDGLIGPETIDAIMRFQNKNLGWGDGRVDPNGKTLAKLNIYADMEGDTGPAPSSVPKPVFTGPKSPNAPAPSPFIDGGALPGAGTPKGSNLKVVSYADTTARVFSVVQSATVALPGVGLQEIGRGLTIPSGSGIYTDKTGFVVLTLYPSGRKIAIPPNSFFPLNQNVMQPLAPAAYYQVGKTVPPSTPAPYYQSGKPAPYMRAGNPTAVVDPRDEPSEYPYNW